MTENGLFEGLEAFGFKDLNKVELFESKTVADALEKETQEKIVTPDQFLYYKSYTCPLCEHQFQERTVRRSKLKLASTDADLKPNYTPVDPIIYDVVICKRCGYSALSAFFSKIWGRAALNIKNNITPNYQSKDYPFVLTIEDGIERNKLALYNAVVKKGKNSEKALICMRIGWLYREKGEKANELKFLKAACDGFIKSYATESTSVTGIGESTMAFLIASFLFKTGKHSESLRWLSEIVVSKSVNSRLKNRALDLKQQVTKDRERSEAAIEA